MPLSLTPPSNTGKVGVAYSSAFVASGGTAPYTYSIPSGSLPTGLSLNSSTGAVTGTPTTVGSYPFQGKVVDSLGNSLTLFHLQISISAAGSHQYRRLLNLLTSKQWSAIPIRETQGELPTDLYQDAEEPNVGIHLWPVPATAVGIELSWWDVLAEFTLLSQQIEFPPAYYDALVFNLAVQLAQVYNVEPDPRVVDFANQKMDIVRDINAQILNGSFGESRRLDSANQGDPQPAGLSEDHDRLGDWIQPQDWSGATQEIAKQRGQQ